ncbi:uncharacterized protein IL334_003193 [Kwoniella shivajii]|uniref:FAD-binding FR-type domain-containing protein n=1 Tax=Kwoniella shivajii TaxID=564305 RepID=A0ABZ1CX73_9TREE|nr:hypothetical protein IL334_003193 [Kwoniella shivajii]
MLALSTARSTCTRCTRKQRQLFSKSEILTKRVLSRQFASTSKSTSSSSTSSDGTTNRSRWFGRRIAITFLGLTIPTTYFFLPSSPGITPHLYSDQTVSCTKTISPQHKLITVDIPSKSIEYFMKPFRRDGSLANSGIERQQSQQDQQNQQNQQGEDDKKEWEIVIQHMMIKSPDIQIERPYTPINDPTKDDQVRMVVKRVRGGEVGRVVHNLKDGDQVGIRGPIPTCSIFPNRYDKIIMISTGTAISPFLQLLSKLPSQHPPNSSSISTPTAAPSTVNHSKPQLHLIHSLPLEGREDWSSSNIDKSFIPCLQDKFGDQLKVTRINPGFIPKETIINSLRDEVKGNKRNILVLICLPPMLMRPLCGDMTPNLGQGPITGILGELGLTNDNVWKLE